MATVGFHSQIKKGKRKTEINRVLYNGQTITNHQAIAEAFNDHFCSIGEKLSNELPDKGTQYRTYLKNRIQNTFFLQPVNEHDILTEIRCLDPKKSPGPDGIGAKLIKLAPECFANILTKIFNKSIQEAEYPDLLKIAKVTAIYKKGKHILPGNYRPISLLSSFNKIFEKIWHRKLITFLERQRALFIYQFGFRFLHSTTFALIETIDKIKDKLDHGNYVLGI